MDEIRKTCLYDKHVALGAKIEPFAGWLMPIEYTGIIPEHTAVRTKSGMFDVSHMGEIRVKGPDALKYIDYVTTNEITSKPDGKVVYGMMLYPNGTVVDDLLTYKVSSTELFLVVNASNVAKDYAWLVEQTEGFDVIVKNLSDEYGEVAVQGPATEALLRTIMGIELADLEAFTFKHVWWDGHDLLVSRTGYTGEDGFEIYADPIATSEVWDILDGLQGDPALRAGMPRHAPLRSGAAALRPRDLRRDHRAGGRPRLLRETRQARLHRQERPGRTEGRRPQAQGRRHRADREGRSARPLRSLFRRNEDRLRHHRLSLHLRRQAGRDGDARPRLHGALRADPGPDPQQEDSRIRPRQEILQEKATNPKETRQMNKVLDGILYNPTHEWAKIDGVVAVIGITAFAASQLGTVVFVDLPAVGAKVVQNKEFGAVESVKAASDLISPLSGTVVEVNDDLVGDPEGINKDAFSAWMIKVEDCRPGRAQEPRFPPTSTAPFPSKGEATCSNTSRTPRPTSRRCGRRSASPRIEEMFVDIPEAVRMKKDYKIPAALSEIEIRAKLFRHPPR
ncbi:MAG: glycine cleavage system protein GcvH [Bacillus subtilis]|nr:glycine cleavage system protein GcvH [Bacillus subtilis]